jgi:1-aminocyclopropane-1-carboxylate deaminase/D-cysteine desulfhydrase-like pyridoxal-dependent ACC family enzyme
MDAKPPLDHVVFACGSGGTACGIAIGIALAFGSLNKSTTPRVHAVGVCDDPDYFYSFVAGIAEEMGLEPPRGATVEAFVRQHMTVHQGKGKGYAIATPEELEFTARFAQSTGIVLDPVYSGKAMYNFMSEIEKHPELYRHKNVLFWHTGGALGLYDKVDDLAPLLSISSPCTRLDVYGRNDGIDLSEPAEQC